MRSDADRPEADHSKADHSKADHSKADHLKADRPEADAGTPESLAAVLGDIARERTAQDEMWGVQEFPDGTGPGYAAEADRAKSACRAASAGGELTWRHILTEEFFESLAESDPERLRAELVQTAAVAVKWVQALDRRHGRSPHSAGHGGGRTEKLVRDRIPEIIEAAGRSPRVRVAGDGEYPALLRAKMYEEAGEYTAAGAGEAAPEELADLLEVVHALARTHGLEPEALEELRAAKSAERGGFARRLVLRLPDPGDASKPPPTPSAAPAPSMPPTSPGFGNTGLADTGLGDTGLADTGLGDTGLADTGLGDTGR